MCLCCFLSTATAALICLVTDAQTFLFQLEWCWQSSPLAERWWEASAWLTSQQCCQNVRRQVRTDSTTTLPQHHLVLSHKLRMHAMHPTVQHVIVVYKYVGNYLWNGNVRLPLYWEYLATANMFFYKEVLFDQIPVWTFSVTQTSIHS